MNIVIEPITHNSEVEALISSSLLPVSDLVSQAELRLFGARLNGKLIGVVGIEAYGSVGLLRSLAVDSDFRKEGYGRALVAHAEAQATELGIQELYLLTMAAAEFFARLGYEVVSRSEAPAAIAKTTQFSGLCPSSATLMCKKLAA
jgi:amino-acid N-acetyltransferase